MIDPILTGDTDSAYIHLEDAIRQLNLTEPADIIELADRLGNLVNEHIQSRVREKFCHPGDVSMLRIGREIVARTGLFKDKKKRYALHILDREGLPPQPGEDIKIMGMETRRSDTPRFIQEFLEHVIAMVVRDRKSYLDVRSYVDEFRRKFRQMDPWRRGSPGRVSGLVTMAAKKQSFVQKQSEGYVDVKKPADVFLVTAATNTNTLIGQNHETRWDYIRDGDKIEVLYLLDNPYNMKTVAIKTDENYVPDWFRALPIDVARMEEKLIDKKLYNTVGAVMQWDFSPVRNEAAAVLEVDNSFYG